MTPERLAEIRAWQERAGVWAPAGYVHELVAALADVMVVGECCGHAEVVHAEGRCYGLVGSEREWEPCSCRRWEPPS